MMDRNFLQNTSSLVSAYGLGTQLVNGQMPLTTPLFTGTSHTLTNPAYSGSLNTSLSPSHPSNSNGHNMSSLSHADTSDESAMTQMYASPAPVFTRHRHSFPYGISGVSMPQSYGYHRGDTYQFTSNGYPRKSRKCEYCHKQFTRSTTRRYHEKRCPALRAAISRYMGEENSGAAGATTPQSRDRVGEVTPHKYDGQGGPTSLSSTPSGFGRSSNPQELATSMLVKSPSSAAMNRRASGETLISGYQTSVIVKQEPHDLEAMANMVSSTNVSLSHKQVGQSQEPLSESVLQFSPESDDSVNNKFEANVGSSPGYQTGLDLSKSPSHTSQREGSTSVLSDEYLREQFKARLDERLDKDGESRTIPQQCASVQHLSSNSQGRYNADAGKDEEEEDDDDDDLMKDDEDMDADMESDMAKDGEDSQDIEERISDMESGEVMEADNEATSSDRRDGKVTGNHKCGICGKWFESLGKLHLHEQLHTKFKPYACKFCGQKFAKSSQRLEHEKVHNGIDTQHICAVCGSSFTQKYSLKQHMRRFHLEGPWLCRHCDKASLTLTELKTHLYSHNLPRTERESLLYMPDVSQADGSNSEPAENGSQEVQDYSMHGDSGAGIVSSGDANAGTEMEMCQECGRDVPKGCMRFHQKSHEAQKPYSCPICGKRFGYKNNMKSHIQLHTGIKRFQCNMCGAKFTRGSTLKRHARRHGIKADDLWDLFVKPDYNKAGANQQQQGRPSKLDTVPTSNTDTSLTATPGGQGRTSSGGGGGGTGSSGDSTNYLATTISPTTLSHGNLHPLYASLGQMAHVQGMYPGLSTTTSYLSQHLPHSSIYAAGSAAAGHLLPQQLDALNLSLQKAAAMDQHSDQSSFSNVSVERSRSRSRSLSGSESRPAYGPLDNKKTSVSDAAVQANICCPPPIVKERMSPQRSLSAKSSTDPATTPTPPTPQRGSGSGPGTPPPPLAVVPYIVTSPSQRPSNVDSTSPTLAMSMFSGNNNYSTETISSLISSGRMFKCFHCECYFSEYAMFRIHAKLHNNDFPFVCQVCGEDCHDRVYFTLHLSEHIR